jgi:hypothetical protein
MPASPTVCISARELAFLAAGPAAGKSQPKLDLPAPASTQLWALAEAEFAPGLVGGKSRNLAT